MREQPAERYTTAPRSHTGCVEGACAVGYGINAAGRLFVGAHPVRDKPTERYIHAWPSRTGCAPTDKRGRLLKG